MTISPKRDWRFLLSLSALVLAGIIVWNIWAFDTVASGGTLGTSTTTSTSLLLNQKSFDTITTIFNQRAAEKVKYETGVYRFADPSQ